MFKIIDLRLNLNYYRMADVDVYCGNRSFTPVKNSNRFPGMRTMMSQIPIVATKHRSFQALQTSTIDVSNGAPPPLDQPKQIPNSNRTVIKRATRCYQIFRNRDTYFFLNQKIGLSLWPTNRAKGEFNSSLISFNWAKTKRKRSQTITARNGKKRQQQQLWAVIVYACIHLYLSLCACACAGMECSYEKNK